MEKNKLYFGDNLDVLKSLYKDYPLGFIDLIYIDPPFNSKRNYNILFESIDMTDTKAQREAFADTWSNVTYLDSLNELMGININLYNFLKNLDDLELPKGHVSYLTTMAIRIYYIHKLLNDTGSFYLHCDPKMSHYLKIICDLVFKEKNFKNEIDWCYKTGGASSKKWSSKHDVILFYTKSNKYTFVPQKEKSYMKPWSGENPKQKYYKDEFGRYTIVNMKDWWIDIGMMATSFKGRLGYDTQKPIELLERIITASSKDGDLIADFFCGCGTTITAAQKLGRRWLGVDISHLAIGLITKNLMEKFNPEIRKSFEIHGFPKDIASARTLATTTDKGRLQFEQWIIEVMLLGVLNKNRTQMGFDGYRTFEAGGKKYIVLIEVKSGSASVTKLHHFIRTVTTKNASMGLFVCFKDQITHNMMKAAKEEGKFDIGGHVFMGDKIQIITVEDLLNHKLPLIPESTKETFKKAEKLVFDLSNSQTIMDLTFDQHNVNKK
jgi:site-specific DNA-methyltransferase (adenine-specific)